MGCNQSKAATTKSSEPVAPQKEQQQTAEVVAIAAAVSVAAPAPEVKQQAEPAAAPATVEASVEQPAAAAEEPVVVAEVAVEKQCDAPEADVPVTPAIVAPVVATTPMTPVKKSSKAAKKQQKQQQEQPAAAPVVEAFSRTAPVAFVGEQENSAVSPKRSALKVAGATPGRTSTGFGLSTKANGNVMSPVRACDADAEKKAVHFAAEPAKQQHQDKVTQIVNKLKKGKGARNGLNKGNVRDEVLLAQISAFERLLTDASTLTRQLDSR